jgi:hypothetical protein
MGNSKDFEVKNWEKNTLNIFATQYIIICIFNKKQA